MVPAPMLRYRQFPHRPGKSDDQLSSLYQTRFFHLNEVTDVCTFQQLTPGRRRANGPMVQAAARFASPQRYTD